MIKELGQGTYGCVYAAQHVETNEKVAIKKVGLYFPEEDRDSSSGVSVSVLRESATLKALSHPGIVSLIEIISTNDSLMYVLEMCDGGTLSERITDLKTRMSSMPWDMLRSFTRQIVDAMAYMHSCRIAHRDLKPLNIVLQGQNTVKLCDFGMSRAVKTSMIPNDASIHDDPRSMYTTGCTTMMYRPPELLLNAKHYNPFSLDRWSIGCIIAEMICLEPLVRCRSDKDCVQRICFLFGTPTEASWPGITKLMGTPGRTKPLRNAESVFIAFKRMVPPDVMAIMNGMLSVNPYQRMTVSEALRLMKETEEDEWRQAEAVQQRKGSKRRKIEFIAPE